MGNKILKSITRSNDQSEIRIEVKHTKLNPKFQWKLFAKFGPKIIKVVLNSWGILQKIQPNLNSALIEGTFVQIGEKIKLYYLT